MGVAHPPEFFASNRRQQRSSDLESAQPKADQDNPSPVFLVLLFFQSARERESESENAAREGIKNEPAYLSLAERQRVASLN